MLSGRLWRVIPVCHWPDVENKRNLSTENKHIRTSQQKAIQSAELIPSLKKEDRKYFLLLGGSVVRGGFHEYPFAFQIPMGNMPSSFKADFGKINYTLKAKLGRPMKVPTKAKTEFTFLSNDDIDTPLLMEPQFGERKEKMKVFTSGNIAMNIHTERMAYLQGEGLKVMVEIENNSSRKIVPKFSLYQKQSHFAKGKRRVVTKQILKEVGDPISVSEHQSITRVLSIPTTVSPTIVNCKVLHVEYRMKVYLDISFAKDPEIKFPIVILPPDCNCGKMLQKWTPS